MPSVTVHLKVWKLSTSSATTFSVLTPLAVLTPAEMSVHVPSLMLSFAHFMLVTVVSCTLPRKNFATALRVLLAFDESNVLPSGVSICTTCRAPPLFAMLIVL